MATLSGGVDGKLYCTWARIRGEWVKTSDPLPFDVVAQIIEFAEKHNPTTQYDIREVVQ